MMQQVLCGRWVMGARRRCRTGALAAAVVAVSAVSWSAAVGADALPVAPQAGRPVAGPTKSAAADPTTIVKQPGSAGPGNPRVAQTVDRLVTPVSRSSSSDSAVTYSSDGKTTVASLSGDVTFDVDSAALTDRAKQVLDEIVSRWNGKPPATVTVVGHTDSVADDAHNQTLSEQRAKAVADYLISKVPSLNVQSSGKGESEPVASETNADGSVNEAGKAANRHVDVHWG